MILLCARCGKVVCLRKYQCCVIFACFAVFLFFNSPVATPAHGLLGPEFAQPESSITSYIGECELVCFVYLCHHPRSHFTKLLTRDLFFGPCHCSYIFVLHLAFGVHVTVDLNKTISFVVGVLSTLFAHALLGLIYQSPSCPVQLRFFKT